MPRPARLKISASQHQLRREPRMFKGRAGFFQTTIWILGLVVIVLLIANSIRYL
jgi:hypothetical protein